MELPLVEPEQVPLPADRVRVLSAQATPYPDGRRIKVSVQLTPFIERPDVELQIMSDSGEALAEASVIECVDPRFEITLHIRQSPSEPGLCRLLVRVRYPDRDLETGTSSEFRLTHSSG